MLRKEMHMEIIVNNFDNLCFNDWPIDNMSLDLPLKNLEIKTQGAYLNVNDRTKHLDNCLIKISNWQSIKISIYDHEKEEWFQVKDDMIDFLKEIDGLEVNGGQLFFRGFGRKTGKWVEFAVTNPVIQVFLFGLNFRCRNSSKKVIAI